MRSPMVNHIQKAIQQNLPSILSATAVLGVIGTVVLAVKATPKAETEVAEARDEAAVQEALRDNMLTEREALELVDSNWTFVKTVKATWKCYIPAAVCGTATIACVVGANAIGMRRHAAILGAYTVADTTLREYTAKVREHLTPQKAQKIDDEIMAEKIARNQPSTELVIIEGGDQLCYESMTGRYFKSTAEKIKRAAQDLDARILQQDMYASCNEFWRELGLGPCTIGEELGWTIECRLKVVFSSHITESQVAVLAIGYETLPVYNYHKI